ncbi:MAG: hypothetical protein IPK67_13605 [Planctomycetes bacterium]|nr:hypothetical protein [Planctomycetota bacterium]
MPPPPGDLAPRPVAVATRAADNLCFIRSTMERSVLFTALPGSAGVLLGVDGAAAAFLGARARSIEQWLAVWIGAACLGLAIGLWSVARRARQLSVPLTRGPARSFAFGLSVPLAAGALITGALWRYGAFGAMPATWMLLYGCALLSAGTFSLRQVRTMGAAFFGAGALTLAVPLSPLAAASNLLLAATFGGLHLLFAALVARDARREVRHG